MQLPDGKPGEVPPDSDQITGTEAEAVNASLALWYVDESLRLTWTFGLALSDLQFEENPLVGKTLYEIFGMDDPEAAPIAAHFNALEGKSATYEVEWGGVVWRATVEPRRDAAGQVVGAVGVAIDLNKLLTAVGQDGPSPPQEALSGYEVLSVGPLQVDPETLEVLKNGARIILTVTEFRLLMEFVTRPGRVLSRAVLAERVWGYEFVGNTTSIAMAIKRLRDKIEEDPHAPTLIETVRGLGYRLHV